MNTTIITLILIGFGAVIALSGVAFGVWIMGRVTGAFNVVSPQIDIANAIGHFGDADEPDKPEYVPFADDGGNSLPSEGEDLGENPKNWDKV